MRALGIAVVFTVLGATAAAAQQPNPFRYQKAMAAGKTLEVRGVIGDIVATAADGNVAEVVATRTARRGNPDDVEIKVVEHADGISICVLYDPDDECGRDGYHSGNSKHNNNTSVRFEVKVPRGVHFAGGSVTGDVEATGLTGDVDAASVSGNVVVSTTGTVHASSVSGSLDLSMGRWTGREDLAFSTVSGDIRLTMPDPVDTEIRFNTVSGSLSSDFPISMTRNDDRGVRGTIGKGGKVLRFSTVTGDIDLRRAR